MPLESYPLIYDAIGVGYRDHRVPDRRIAARIHDALGNAQTICNVGAGTGSYEPVHRDVIAVEPSQTMIGQRRSLNRVVCASAEQLPFADREFDASMAVLTVHHWTDARAGLAQLQRISQRQVVFTFDPDMLAALWLVDDYLPEIIDFERQRATPLSMIVDALQADRIETVTIPCDCTDGFQGAYWRRPAEYLKPAVRAAISTLSQLPPRVVSQAMRQLSDDLQSGEWHRRYAHLLDVQTLDLGYRLVVSEASFGRPRPLL